MSLRTPRVQKYPTCSTHRYTLFGALPQNSCGFFARKTFCRAKFLCDPLWSLGPIVWSWHLEAPARKRLKEQTNPRTQVYTLPFWSFHLCGQWFLSLVLMVFTRHWVTSRFLKLCSVNFIGSFPHPTQSCWSISLGDPTAKREDWCGQSTVICNTGHMLNNSILGYKWTWANKNHNSV